MARAWPTVRAPKAPRLRGPPPWGAAAVTLLHLPAIISLALMLLGTLAALPLDVGLTPARPCLSRGCSSGRKDTCV